MPPIDDPFETPMRVPVERQHARRPIKADALIRNITQGRIGGRLLDISENGCKVDLYRNSGTVGQMVTIKLENVELWVGHVHWVKGNVIGVRFDRPMHPAVVDHLSRSHPTFELS